MHGHSTPLNLAEPRMPPGARPVLPPRHVWVKSADREYPGILTAWLRQESGWTGHTVYACDKYAGEAALVANWVPADQLRPA